jgi:SWI/SNF-related matrix-associated actin-dependent regulator of chromatin subfamily A-like protein 1
MLYAQRADIIKILTKLENMLTREKEIYAGLYGYQQEGATWLRHVKRAILGDEMGIGKTRQAIAAAYAETGGAVVVCLASGKISTWAREIVTLDPDATVLVVNSGNDIQQYSIGDGSYWVVINYDLLDKHVSDMPQLYPNYKTVILDEAHYIKEGTTIRGKAAVKLCTPAENIYLLTGTPVMNRPIELFNLLKTIRHPLGENWFSYAMKYCGAYQRKVKKWVLNPQSGQRELREIKFIDVKGATNLDKLRTELSTSYLRRTKAALGDKLPPMVPDYIITELDKKHQALYADAWDNYFTNLELRLNADDDIDEDAKNEKLMNAEMAQHLVEMQKLKQVASLSKVERIADDAENALEQGEQVIIFTQYTATLEALKERLKKHKPVSISGADNAKHRLEAIDDFQAGKSKVFIGNTKAAGTGINLFAASLVYFADLEWTPALHEQAISRAHRNGQQKQVNAYYYIAKNTIDEDIKEALIAKKVVIDEILEGKKDTVKDTNVQAAVLKAISNRRLIHS